MCEVKYFCAVPSYQLLVGGDYVFAVADRTLDKIVNRLDSSGDFNDDVYFRIIHDFERILCQADS